MADAKPTQGERQIKHGLNGYTNYACRCETCRAANTDRMRRRRAERVGDIRTPHGTFGGYTNWGCRCEKCCEANTAARRAWRAPISALRNP